MLDSFFYPKSIAIIGSFRNEAKPGYQILKNLLDLGFEGPVYPVYPKLESVFGLTCYPTLTEVPGEVELMVILVPAPGVPAIFEEAAARGDVRAAVVIAAGFSETAIPERVELERRMVEVASRAGIRVFGPNCVGVMNQHAKLDTTFAPSMRKAEGGMSLLSQSGSLGAMILKFAGEEPAPIGFSKWAHVGNMCDVDLVELLEYYRDDPDTKLIVAYMEGIENAREFMEVARGVTPQKPVVVLKVGRTESGSQAALSHTGSLAGADALYEGAFRQAGVIRADTIDELLDTAKILSLQPLPQGRRICVLTEAGGLGITAMDELMEAGDAELAKLGPDTVNTLKELLPAPAIVNRPAGYIDMSAAADEQNMAGALQAVLGDPGVDGVVLLAVPPSFLDAERLVELVISAVGGAATPKPVATCFLGGPEIGQARETMEEAGLPTFTRPERAARAMSNMDRRIEILRRLGPGGVPEPEAPAETRRVVEEIHKTGATEVAARKLLEAYGVSTGPWKFVQTPEEALDGARDFGYPVVLKVVSPQVVHKTEAGGVCLNIESPEELLSALATMKARVHEHSPEAELQGFLIAAQAGPGPEVIVGTVRDSQLGPMVMFGMGGTTVELYGDAVFRMAPITIETARDMVGCTKGSRLLEGFRGAAACDIEALAQLLVSVSRVVADHGSVSEFELNPVRVYEHGLAVLDARVVLV